MVVSTLGGMLHGRVLCMVLSLNAFVYLVTGWLSHVSMGTCRVHANGCHAHIAQFFRASVRHRYQVQHYAYLGAPRMPCRGPFWLGSMTLYGIMNAQPVGLALMNGLDVGLLKPVD